MDRHSALLLILLFAETRSFGDELILGNLNIIPWRNKYQKAIFELAIQKLQNDNVLSENITIEFFEKFGGCSSHNDPGHAVELYMRKKINVLFSSGCSNGGQPTGKLAAYWDLPFIEWFATDEVFADKKLFPTLPRVSLSMDMLGAAVSEFLSFHNWKRAALVTTTKNSQAVRFANGLRSAFRKADIEMAADIDIANSKLTIDAALEKLNSSARIIIVGLSSDIKGSREFMMKAHELNMTTTEYVYLIPYLLKPSVGSHTTLPWNDTESMKAYRQAFVHVPEGLDDDTVISFWRKLNNKTLNDPAFNFSTPLFVT